MPTVPKPTPKTGWRRAARIAGNPLNPAAPAFKRPKAGTVAGFNPNALGTKFERLTRNDVTLGRIRSYVSLVDELLCTGAFDAAVADRTDPEAVVVVIVQRKSRRNVLAADHALRPIVTHAEASKSVQLVEIAHYSPSLKVCPLVGLYQGLILRHQLTNLT